MCGIFGYIASKYDSSQSSEASETITALFKYSESRGREAAGIALQTPRNISIFRSGLSATAMMRTKEYRKFTADNLNVAQPGPLTAIGHARLVTNGLQAIDSNNQPVAKSGAVVIHNGIIVNDGALWRQNPSLRRTAEVDTEIIADLVQLHRREGRNEEQAIAETFSQIRGEASVAIMFDDAPTLALATNTGSLYWAKSTDGAHFFFVSEGYIARELTTGDGARRDFAGASWKQLHPGRMLLVNPETLECHEAPLDASPSPVASPAVSTTLATQKKIEVSSARAAEWRNALRRCSKCLLPETMPFIEFDTAGVCNFCRRWRPPASRGRAELEKKLDAIRSKDGSPDCLVAFSGGRDSSYGLHLLRREFGMTPIAYTYDWGMVTDLARRNQARLCGDLGIEHLWVSADIKAKRRYVRHNVNTWLRRPDLGMVPLFMTGDKPFFWYANKTMKQTGISTMIFCMNHYERTDFKAGFAGSGPEPESDRTFTLNMQNQIAMAAHYGKNYLLNPGYINASLLDTLFGFVSYYLIDRPYLYMFDYLDWDERELDDVLRNTYGWEVAHDTTTTWRIGDATAPFYNYIYHTVAGFTENDTFRSNQIRAGVIDRETAARNVARENEPRWDSMREYLGVIGVDFDTAIRVIDAIPKLYGPNGKVAR